MPKMAAQATAGGHRGTYTYPTRNDIKNELGPLIHGTVTSESNDDIAGGNNYLQSALWGCNNPTHFRTGQRIPMNALLHTVSGWNNKSWIMLRWQTSTSVLTTLVGDNYT